MEEGAFFAIETFASTGKTQFFVFDSNLIFGVKQMVVLLVACCTNCPMLYNLFLEKYISDKIQSAVII